MWIRVAITAGLAALTFALYAPVAHHEFLALDDRRVVVENPLVKDGLSADAVRRAFTTAYLGNWIPLTYVSLQIDRSLWGTDAGPMLLVNAGLHALATALCFLAFAAMTGAVWPSAFVAAVFGLHPLHVESVAWASERKDVLSGVLFMATLLAWWHYTRAPGVLRYAGAALVFALGLMAKPMLVTLPFVLLLLDSWPLRRLGVAEGSAWPDAARLRQAVLEKVPLLALAAIASATALRTQTEDAAVYPSHVLTLGLRIANAFVSYAAYLRDALWPVSLGAFYLHPLADVDVAAAATGALLVVGVGLVALRLLPERPWLAVGWLWYLGTLVPVIGLVQVGMQARADRYTYLPLVGFAVIVAWGGAELARRVPRALVGAAAVAACAGMAFVTSRQIPHWQDSEAVFRRAIEVTGENWVAEQGLGFALLDKDAPAEAAPHFAEAVRLNPGFARPRAALAYALIGAGRRSEAIPHYERALALSPDDALIQGNLGVVLADEGRHTEAEPHLERALALHERAGSDPSQVHRALGAVRAAQGRPAEALEHYERALLGLSSDVNVLAQAGIQAEQAGLPGRAVAHYREALRVEPRFVGAANNLAWLLATCGEEDVRAPEEALAAIERALETAGGEATAALLDTRAAANAAAGRFEEARQLADEAIEAAEREGLGELASQARDHRRRFQRGEALRRACRDGA